MRIHRSQKPLLHLYLRNEESLFEYYEVIIYGRFDHATTEAVIITSEYLIIIRESSMIHDFIYFFILFSKCKKNIIIFN